MATINTILPFFILISLGWFAREKGFVPAEFLGPANRLTFYFAIPALVFRSVSKASLRQDFHGEVLLMTLAAAATVYSAVWIYCWRAKVPDRRASAMIQSAAHGNLGYIGLPFALYFLGESGFAKASIISGLLAILQNFFSVSALQVFSNDKTSLNNIKSVLSKLLSHPVILASVAGMLVSWLAVPQPQVLQRTLDMLGSLAPPLALLLIGASLSFRSMRTSLRQALGIVLVKLLLLPALGLALFLAFAVPTANYLPGLILLACPTATVAYVMAREMDGDPEFVVATISGSTILSAVTFMFWMGCVMKYLN